MVQPASKRLVTEAALANPASPAGAALAATVARDIADDPEFEGTAFEAVYGVADGVAAPLRAAAARDAAARRRDLLPSRLTTRQIAPAGSTPVVTFASGTEQITSVNFNGGTDVIATGKVTVIGCPASKVIHPTGGFPATVTYRPLNVRAPDVTGATASAWWGIDFLTDSPQVELRYYNRGGMTIRFSVDEGVVTSLTPTNYGSPGNYETLLLDFSALSPASKLRRVKMEWSGLDLYRVVTPIPSGYSVTPYTLAPAPVRGPLALWPGDSLTGGSPVDSGPQVRIPQIVGERMGWRSHNVAIGGSGHITNNTNVNNGVAQANALIAAYAGTDVDIIINTLGHNDPAASAAAITTAVTTQFNLYANAFPNALQVYTGPLGAVAASNVAALTTIENAIIAGLPAGTPFIPQVAAPWIFGSGYTHAQTKDGNADLYIGQASPLDLVHWNNGGIALVAERMVRELQRILSVPR